MKEARQVFRDTRRWKYKIRSRYIVKPDLVDSLMVHWVHSTKGRAREVVVPQSAAVLAHFRQQLPDGIQLAGPEIKIANNFVSKGDRKPDLHLEKLVAKVVEKVQRVCQHLQNCDFIKLGNYKK